MTKRTDDITLAMSRDNAAEVFRYHNPEALAVFLARMEAVLDAADVGLDQEQDQDVTITIYAAAEDYEGEGDLG